jgi:hypothetical protein
MIVDVEMPRVARNEKSPSRTLVPFRNSSLISTAAKRSTPCKLQDALVMWLHRRFATALFATQMFHRRVALRVH